MMDTKLQQFVHNNVEGVDLLLSALYSAATSYRRATVCKPFPSQHFPSSEGNQDFQSLTTALQSLPDVNNLATCGPSSAYGALLHWLFFDRNHHRTFHPVSIHSLDHLLTHCCGWPPDPHNPSFHPTLTLELRDPNLPSTAPPESLGTSSTAPVQPPNLGPSSTHHQPQSTSTPPIIPTPPSPPAFPTSLLAFHGTSFENLHSILHNGLLNASGTSLQRNGSLFGEGIYFSSDYRTAYGFSSAGTAWPASRLGSRLRCVLVCELDVGRESLGTKVLTGLDTRNTPAGGSTSMLPQTYWLVKSPDAARLRYLLIYRDSPPLQARAPSHAGPSSLAAWLAGINWLVVGPVLYAVVMVLIGLRG